MMIMIKVLILLKIFKSLKITTKILIQFQLVHRKIRLVSIVDYSLLIHKMEA